MKTVWFWTSTFTIALTIFSGLCWLDMRPGSTLHSAVAAGNVKLIKKQLAGGSDINALDKEGLTPLCYAVRGNDLEMVKLLLEHGANTELRDNQERTPLLMTAQFGFVEIFELLARSGANIDAKLSSGETSLELASANRHAGIVDFLADYRRELKTRRPNFAEQF